MLYMWHWLLVPAFSEDVDQGIVKFSNSSLQSPEMFKFTLAAWNKKNELRDEFFTCVRPRFLLLMGSIKRFSKL